jgi:ubiquinone/menaquinone biosynthesis C-methylase UbiE
MEFKGLSAILYDYSLNLLLFGKEKSIRKKIASLIPNKEIKILAIGCGTGTQLIEIKKQRRNVKCYGIDASKDMLDIAKKKAKRLNLHINFHQQSMNDLKFRDNYFDVVIASLSLHEVDYNTRKEAVKEIARVLKKNGKFILFDFIKTRGFPRLIQKLVFLIFEKHAENFLKTKEKVLDEFKKDSFKSVLGVLSIEEYS